MKEFRDKVAVITGETVASVVDLPNVVRRKG